MGHETPVSVPHQGWLPSEVTEVTGPVSFMVRLEDGRIIRRNESPGVILPENEDSSPQTKSFLMFQTLY